MRAGGLLVGIAFDLRVDFAVGAGEPEDRLEEYDSTATVDGLQKALESHGHTVRRLGGGRLLLETLLRDPPQLVFNIAEGYGTRSREAHVPAVCEMLRVPYTHSDPLTLAATLDKAVAKKIVSADGVPTPKWVVADRPDAPGLEDLAFPVFAKPVAEGSSMGIRKTSRIDDLVGLRESIRRLALDYDQPVLVEEYCPGVEFTVGVVGTGAEARVVNAMEIVPKKVRHSEFVYSLEVKRDWVEEVDYHVPPKQPAALVRRVEEVALGAYRSLGCRDVSRVDVRVGADGEPKFLEVNPLPGLNPDTGDLSILVRMSGKTYPWLIGEIVASARKRQGL